MGLEMIDRLEELVGQLLTERTELRVCNQKLTDECDVLIQDRARVSNELDNLLEKLERLESKTS